MDQLNNMESRQVTAKESMQRLEKACMAADQRIRIRRDVTTRSAMLLGLGVAMPLSAYMIYHLFAAHGVMQNYKASSGAYMYWP